MAHVSAPPPSSSSSSTSFPSSYLLLLILLGLFPLRSFSLPPPFFPLSAPLRVRSSPCFVDRIESEFLPRYESAKKPVTYSLLILALSRPLGQLSVRRVHSRPLASRRIASRRGEHNRTLHGSIDASDVIYPAKVSARARGWIAGATRPTRWNSVPTDPRWYTMVESRFRETRSSGQTKPSIALPTRAFDRSS